MRTRWSSLLASFVACAWVTVSVCADPPTGRTVLADADRLFKDQHWAEARTAYDLARERLADWHAPDTRRAVEGAAACAVRLEQWDDAVGRLDAYISHTSDTLDEVAGQRLLAVLYLTMPHSGATKSGRLVRGPAGDDVEDSDEREAIRRLERARAVIARLTTARPGGGPESERRLAQEWINTDFDLTTAVAQWVHPGAGNHPLERWLGLALPPQPSEPDENTPWQPPRSALAADYDTHEPPAGIPRRADGTLWFARRPEAYDTGLVPAEKFLCLTAEIERLDTSEHRDDAAKALVRRAAMAQNFYGAGITGSWMNWWQSDRSPHGAHVHGEPPAPPAPAPATKVWQLGDDQALVPVGGWLKLVDLPAEESPLALLAAVEARYPQSTLLPEARYARALYFQERQQYPRALSEYRDILRLFPAHPLTADARARIKEIEKPGIELGDTETDFPGDKPKVSFAVRNAEKVLFTARRFDLVHFREAQLAVGGGSGEPDFSPKGDWRKYVGKDAVRWSEAVPPGQENRPLEMSTFAPLPGSGAYVIEARLAEGKEAARVLVVVTDILLLSKNARDGDGPANLLVACDARTGRPLPNRAMRVYESWKDPDDHGRKGATHLDRQTRVTDANGAVFYHRHHHNRSSRIEAAMVGDDGKIAFSTLHDARDNDPAGDPANEETRVGFLVTDRPVYRPGTTVHYCVWLRNKRGGIYKLPPPGPVWVSIRCSGRYPVQTTAVQIDETGTVSGEYTLGPSAPLGTYSIWVSKNPPDSETPEGWTISRDSFAVEEYRPPEFEVNVRPAATQTRLGEKFKATVEARYYFGAPVAQAKVSYRVYREVFERSYFEPAEYDSIYGKGYGLSLYPCPWMSWWERWGGLIGWGAGRQEPVPMPRWNEELYDPRELVAQGEATLDARGRCEVEVDTARAKAEHGGHDQQYTVEATVIGASRRAVSGEGAVVATRQGFYAFVETDRGWYNAGQEARLRVRALTPGNVPVAVKGQVTLSRVHYDGAENVSITEEEVSRQDAETDAEGRLSCKVALPEEGQYHAAFHARDAWGEEVLGNVVFWVQGPRFDGRRYRANDLEIVADQRSYRVGETAHLLINTSGDDARILFARHETDGLATQVRFVDAPRRSVVVDVPIDEQCVPNVFFEATVVRDGQVRVESCELVVPAAQKLLDLAVRADKDAYAPGEKATVHVEATDKSGRPASGSVTLTVFDKAVTAIQAESDASPDGGFYGQNSFYPPEVDSTFDVKFSATNPSTTFLSSPVALHEPEGWDGSWEIGAGMKRSPIRESIHASTVETASADRIIVTGSNVPSSEEVGPPTSLDSPSAASRKPAASADPRDRRPATGPADPTIRTRFADTALWLPALKLDADGKADAEFDFPQSLSAWRLHGYVVNADTQVGEGTAGTTTTKKLLVRLLSPRFFTERDEVVLSAAANNYLPDAQEITAELIVPATLFQPLEGSPGEPDADGNLHLTARASVAPDSEHRFDWRVRVSRPGMATITARELTTQGSDGMRLAFPVAVHGIEKTLMQSGSFRTGQDGERTLRVELPAEVDPAQTRLEIVLSPSLAAVMIDALPYLADYPYGCVEQTMSRFYPSVLVRETLKRMGTDLETLGNQRRQMNPADLANRFGESPVYDSARLDGMIHDGLISIYNAESGQGGWGWWAGEEPSLAQSVYVLQGLHAAKAAGVALDESVYHRGFAYVWRTVSTELAKPAKKQALGDVQQQAYCAYVLTLEPLLDLEDVQSGLNPERAEALWNRWLDILYARRGELNNYGRALLALTLQHARREAQARTVLRNLLQFIERDDSNETAWVRTPSDGWWFWWNNDIETNAWALKALVALDPKNDLASRLVKWLLNNRHGGTCWRGTRDTAQVISAMTDYLLASGEGNPDCTASVSVDGEMARSVHVTRENLFAFDNKITVGGAAFGPGAHEIVFRKQGAGALYYSCRLTYFTHEEGVKGAGGEIGVERRYFKLVPETRSVRRPTDGTDPAASHAEMRDGYEPVPLNDGDELASGELIEVVLKITAKNTYDYLAFEDPKPAGCEAVEVRSGQRWADGFCANVELRDGKTVFFVERLEQGESVLRYRLRAETPGKFHALPATGAAIYAPELRANSDETRIGIREQTN